MKFENNEGKAVELNFQNFDSVLPGGKSGLTPVKFKNGNQEWLKATEEQILKAVEEE